jgi:succinylglutamate desuccinylase
MAPCLASSVERTSEVIFSGSNAMQCKQVSLQKKKKNVQPHLSLHVAVTPTFLRLGGVCPA